MQHQTLINAWGEPNQPEPLFKALDRHLNEICGHKLLTYLQVDGDHVARLYSNMPHAYPVYGRKHMGPTEWGKLVIEQGQAFLGLDKKAIEWAFYDYELIESLGLGSVISVPVRYDGRTIGVISMLDEEHHYKKSHVDPSLQAAAFLVPAFLMAEKAGQNNELSKTNNF